MRKPSAPSGFFALATWIFPMAHYCEVNLLRLAFLMLQPAKDSMNAGAKVAVLGSVKKYGMCFMMFYVCLFPSMLFLFVLTVFLFELLYLRLISQCLVRCFSLSFRFVRCDGQLLWRCGWRRLQMRTDLRDKNWPKVHGKQLKNNQ